MPELRDRFSMADEIQMQDLWTEARRRADAPETSARPLAWVPAPRKRLTAGIVAFTVFVAASIFAWNLSHPDRSPSPRPAPAVDLAAQLPAGWSELPAPPEVRTGAATAWTGSQLLVWGGYEYTGYGDESSRDDGFLFDAASRAWTKIPDGPLEARSFAGGAWTGSEFLVWGGHDTAQSTDSFSGGFSDGAAYDPETRSWSMLPEAPILGRAPLSVWTGEEFIVWGTGIRAGPYLDGAAYDPRTRSWRVIPDAPIELTDATAAWTGEEMIVVGAALDGNNRADTPRAIGAAYDPKADVWRELPASNLSPQAMTAAWLNGELVAWDYDLVSEAYDPGVDRWRPLPGVPLEFSECGPESVSTARIVLGDFCGDTVVFTAEEQTWRRAPLPPCCSCCRANELVAAGDVVLAMSHAIAIESLDAADRRMFAYNPPEAVSTGPPGEVLQPEPFIPRNAERDGDHLRLPVVFPNGTRATLVYPIALDLAALGVQPEVSYLWRSDPPPRFPIVFLHDRRTSIAEYVDATEPVGSVPSYRSIEIWKMSDEWSDRRRLPQGHWLRYGLPSWTVLVALEDADQAEDVAKSLQLHETAAGFPVAETSGPIALSEESGEGEASMLAIGSSLDPSVLLWLERCRGGGIDEGFGAYGSACLADGRIFASIYGRTSVVEAIMDGLRIEDFVAT
jgi:hypothetical protein